MAALIDATTGYANDIADWTDTTPQPGSADSGTTSTGLVTSFLWPSFSIVPGQILDFGGTRTVYVKAFEAGTDPTLSLIGALSWITFMLVGSLTLVANLLLSAQLLRKMPMAMAAVAAFHGSTFKETLRLRTAALNFAAAITRSRSILFAQAISFIGDCTSRVSKRFTEALLFVTDFLQIFNGQFIKALSGVISFTGARVTGINKKLTTILGLRFVGVFIKRSLRIPFTATLSFATLFSRFDKLFAATLSFSGDVASSLLHFAVVLRSAISFLGTVATFKFTTFHALLQSTIRFGSSTVKGWLDVFANVFTTIHMALDRVFGYVTTQYRVTNIVRSPRDTQSIGTSPQLIDLSDLVDPPPVLLIKNTNDNYFVEVDSVNTFDAFPQKIPPQRGVLLSPNTTTIYARAIGSPVDILLSPSEPSVAHRIRLDARLSLSGGLPGFLPPITTLYVRFFVMFDQDEYTSATTQGTIIDFFSDMGALDADLLFSLWPDFTNSANKWWLGTPTTNVSIDDYLTFWIWYQIDLKIEIGGGNIVVTPTLYGIDYPALTVSGAQLGSFSFGSRYGGTTTNRYLDSLTMDTRFRGGSNIFYVDFNDLSIVPPFDSTSGPGISVASGYLPDYTYSRGSMLVHNTVATPAYTVKDLIRGPD